MKRKAGLIAVLAIVFVGSGCGRAYSGSYNGSATLTMNGTTPMTSAVQVVIDQQTANSQVTGRISGSFGTGSFSGTATGDIISNVMLTFTQTNAYSNYGAAYPMGTVPAAVGTYPQTGVYQTTGAYCGTMTMTGTMNFVNNQLSGNLNSMGSTTPALTGTYCTGSIAITAAK